MNQHHVATLPLKGEGEFRMGSILQEQGKLKPEDVDRVLRTQKQLGSSFGETAVQLGLVDESDVRQVLARQFGYDYLEPGQGNYPSELVAAYEPFSPQVETLRGIRAQLMQRWFERGKKKLVVVSADPGDGTSFFAANLAVVFSQLGEKTLLIDANLRAPRQHEIFNLKGRQGLSDILAGRAGIETFSKVDSFVHLSVLPAGTIPPNPQELLSRAAFSEINESLSNRFDIILIDVPAFSVGTDALTVAARAGGALLVCHKDKTHMGKISILSERLSSAGVEVLGSVLVEF